MLSTSFSIIHVWRVSSVCRKSYSFLKQILALSFTLVTFLSAINFWKYSVDYRVKIDIFIIKNKLIFFSKVSKPYLKISTEMDLLRTPITGLILRGIP